MRPPEAIRWSPSLSHRKRVIEQGQTFMTRVTITDVDRTVGTSKKTISRVLNNDPNVSQSMRQRVTDAVAALNYRPLTSARSLAANRSFMIAQLHHGGAGRRAGGVRGAALQHDGAATGLHRGGLRRARRGHPVAAPARRTDPHAAAHRPPAVARLPAQAGRAVRLDRAA